MQNKSKIQVLFFTLAVSASLTACSREAPPREIPATIEPSYEAEGQAGAGASDMKEEASNMKKDMAGQAADPKMDPKMDQKINQADDEAAPAAAAGKVKDSGPWVVGDMIASGMKGVPNIEILEVHGNGQGEPAGLGKSATLKYVAMKADGTVVDAGRRPFTFRVGSGQAIKGWDVIVSKMRVGDNFTIALPKGLAYGDRQGDMKFDMELLSFE